MALPLSFPLATASAIIGRTRELDRILALPRRTDIPALAEQMTDALRAPQGTQVLRPIQAQALYDLGMTGGLFGPIRVGAGKTLISLLAASMVRAERPLLIIPAKLRDKTEHDLSALSEHWRIQVPFVATYEWLSRVQASAMLSTFQPDLIVLDECHKAKNRRAAVARRIERYLRTEPCHVVAMSGTVTKRSILDYAHLVAWCYHWSELMPLPRIYDEIEQWAQVLDQDDPGTDVGALRLFGEPVRDGYRRRLVESPGIVASHETPIDASIELTAIEVPAVEEPFATLRTRWESPDGWPMSDAPSIWRCARQLSLGFYYIWNPRPPEPWLDVRRAWCSFVRHVLGESRTLDTELQVAQRYATEPALTAWQQMRPTFEPHTEPRWFDDTAILTCARWLRANAGICWTEHVAFARMLADVTGLPYYGRMGCTDDGRSIDLAHGPIIASIPSNAEGRNLQRYATNLVTSPPADGGRWEQLMGRTHREGQTADTVTVDVLCSCREHVTAMSRALADARYIEQTTGAVQKLLLADVVYPTAVEIEQRGGAQWHQ